MFDGEGLDGLPKVTTFKFKDSGRELLRQPDEVGLVDLLKPFSSSVLEVLDRTGVVLVQGESGLGKTELFLGQSNPEINIKTGGINQLLLDRGESTEFVSLQSRVFNRVEDVETFIERIGQVKKTILADEVGRLIQSDKGFGLISRLGQQTFLWLW